MTQTAESVAAETHGNDRKSSFLMRCLQYCWFCPKTNKLEFKNSSTATYEPLPQDDTVDVDDFDWWTKFYESVEVG